MAERLSICSMKDMPRLSVDIDITYIPVRERDESLATINGHLLELKRMIERTIPGIRVLYKPDVWKLLCMKDRATVKIEVNGTKRGIIALANGYISKNLFANIRFKLEEGGQGFFGNL